MLDPDITLNKVAQDHRWNADATTTPFIRVEFMVGKHGPFVEKFDKDAYSADIRDQRLNQFAREVR